MQKIEESVRHFKMIGILDVTSLLLMKDLSKFHRSHLRRKFEFSPTIKELFNTWLTGRIWETLLAWTYSKLWKTFLDLIIFTWDAFPQMLTSQAIKLLTALLRRLQVRTLCLRCSWPFESSSLLASSKTSPIGLLHISTISAVVIGQADVLKLTVTG